MEQQELTGVAPARKAIPTKRKVYVGAPATCNACNGQFNGEMFDARISASSPGRAGRWGNLCHDCFHAFGCGLGTGLGQRYVWEPEGWIKVAG